MQWTLPSLSATADLAAIVAVNDDLGSRTLSNWFYEKFLNAQITPQGRPYNFLHAPRTHLGSQVPSFLINPPKCWKSTWEGPM